MAETLNNVLVVRATHTDLADTSETFTMARAASVMDVVLIATNGGAGTVTVKNGANAITAALDPSSTDTAVIRPTTGAVFTAAEKDLAVGDVLTFDPSAATGLWECYAYLYPTPAVAE